MQISKHAIERYVQRTMDKTGIDEKIYIVQNESTIKERIEKLFDSTTLLYEGRLREYGYAQTLINKNGWVLIYDAKQDNLITVYKVDLGLDDEFNQVYVDKYRSKILSMNNEFNLKNQKLQTDQNETNQQISNNKQTISQLEQQIAILKKENGIYEEQIQLARDKVNLFEKDIKSEIEKFVCTKLF